MDYRESIPTAAALMLASLGRPGVVIWPSVFCGSHWLRAECRVGEAARCGLGGRDRDDPRPLSTFVQWI